MNSNLKPDRRPAAQVDGCHQAQHRKPRLEPRPMWRRCMRVSGPEGSTILVGIFRQLQPFLAEVRNSFNGRFANLGKPGPYQPAYNTYGILLPVRRRRGQGLGGPADGRGRRQGLQQQRRGADHLCRSPRHARPRTPWRSSLGELKFDILEQRMIPQGIHFPVVRRIQGPVRPYAGPAGRHR